MPRMFRRVAKLTAITGVAISLTGCSLLLNELDPIDGDLFSPEGIHALWERAAITEPYDSNRFTFHQDALMQIQHGASCARANSALSKDTAGNFVIGVRVSETAAIPSNYDSATVFLNGWRLKYSDSDHHVLGLSTAIVDIAQDSTHLHWTAGGVIGDRNGDDGYAWCYHYTLLFWNSSHPDFNAWPNDGDETTELTFIAKDASVLGTALNRSRNTLYGFDDPAALLPRGFGVAWANDWDHHLLHFAIKYGDIEVAETSNGAKDASWDFEVIFKDDESHDIYAAQVVTLLEGASVDILHTPLEIEPRPETDPTYGYTDVRSHTITVEDVPFDYAVPVLKGWDIGDSSKDIHIKDIGAWIESFDYEKAPDSATGTLTYTIKSVFLDRQSPWSSIGFTEPRYQVAVLGFNRLGLYAQPPSSTSNTIDEPSEPPSSTTSTTNAGTLSTVTPMSSSTATRFGRQLKTKGFR